MKSRMVLCSLLVLASGLCHAESQIEQAKIPYAIIYKVATVEFRQIENLKKEETSLFVSSKLPDVKPQEIELYIDSKSGKIPFKLNSDGTFSFPLRNTLLEENPFIVANQPKGTMQFRAAIILRGDSAPNAEVVSGDFIVRYVDLFNSRTLMNRMVNQLTEDIKDHVSIVPLGESATWSEFTPTNPINIPAVIQSMGGDIRVSPDPDGVFRIRFDPKLAEENPSVTFPGSGTIEVVSTTAK